MKTINNKKNHLFNFPLLGRGLGGGLLLLALLLASCNEEKQESGQTIVLSAPENNAAYNLYSVEDITFEWSLLDDVDNYKIAFSLKDDMQKVAMVDAATSPHSLPAAEIDEALQRLGMTNEATDTVYWSVRAWPMLMNIVTQVRPLILTRKPFIPVAVTGVSVDPTAKTLDLGETFTPTATVMPDNATNKAVTWSSNNGNVATVNETTGLVTAAGTGTATITATTVDGGHTATIAVTVQESAEAQAAQALATALGNATASGATVPLTGNVTVENVTIPEEVTLAVPSGDTLTVTGTLSGAGTLTVAGVADVTTSNFTGAVDLQNGGATNVGFTAPSGAASGLVWKFGSQTWSDLIQLPACDGQFTPNVTTAAGGTFTHNETKRFVYNWYYVNENAGTLCPEGWRVPTKADADALVSAAGQASFLTDRWGYGGQLNYAGDKDMADVALLYWTSTEVDTDNAYDLTAVPEWGMFLTNSNVKYLGKQVRCVKE